MTVNEDSSNSILEKASYSIANKLTDLELDEAIVHNPDLAKDLERRRQTLLMTHQKEIYDNLKKDALILSKFPDCIEPYLSQAAPEMRELFFKDRLKWGDLSRYVDSNDELLTIRRHCKISDETINFLYDSAYQAMIEKRFDESHIICAFLNFLDPFQSRTWLLMGFCQKELQQYDEALNSLTNALNLNPELNDAYIYMTECYVSLRQYDKAQQTFDKIDLFKEPDLQSYVTSLKLKILKGV